MEKEARQQSDAGCLLKKKKTSTAMFVEMNIGGSKDLCCVDNSH